MVGFLCGRELNPVGSWIRRVGCCLRSNAAPHWFGAFFTLLLAVFAILAWQESKRTTKALQGQLDVLKAEQRPYLYPSNVTGGAVTGLPSFEADTGQAVWNFHFTNFGHSVAYNVFPEVFIKIGDESFQPNSTYAKRVTHVDLPPGVLEWATGYSRKGFNADYFNTMMKQDGAIQIKVKFHYSGASLKETYESGFCLVHNSNNSVGQLTFDECQDR